MLPVIAAVAARALPAIASRSGGTVASRMGEFTASAARSIAASGSVQESPGQNAPSADRKSIWI